MTRTRDAYTHGPKPKSPWTQPKRSVIAIEPDEARRLIDAAIAAGRVTKCAPGAAAGVGETSVTPLERDTAPRGR